EAQVVNGSMVELFPALRAEQSIRSGAPAQADLSITAAGSADVAGETSMVSLQQNKHYFVNRKEVCDEIGLPFAGPRLRKTLE
ncbi:MAG: hypothetical protein ACK2UU_02495, partial [Anaerolineae bacterium]